MAEKTVIVELLEDYVGNLKISLPAQKAVLYAFIFPQFFDFHGVIQSNAPPEIRESMGF